MQTTALGAVGLRLIPYTVFPVVSTTYKNCLLSRVDCLATVLTTFSASFLQKSTQIFDSQWFDLDHRITRSPALAAGGLR